MAGHAVIQTPGGGVLLNAEDDLGDTIGPRLERLNSDDTRITALKGIGGCNAKSGKPWTRSFSLEHDLSHLDETLVEKPDTRLVVIDPVAAYLGSVDSHKNSDVRGMLAPLTVVTVTRLSKRWPVALEPARSRWPTTPVTIEWQSWPVGHLRFKVATKAANYPRHN